MQRSSKKATAALVAVLALSLGVLAAPTADEILDLVQKKGIMGGETGTMTADVRFDVAVGQPNTASHVFRVFSLMDVAGEPDKLLVVYLEPELVAGTMFLTYTPDEGDSRMWLYLPALSVVKELVSEESRQQEFVSGSGVSRSEISNGFSYKADYAPTLLGEETVDGMPVYVLSLAPREGRSPDWQSIKLWVHRDEYAVVRIEFTDREGRLAKIVTGGDFYTDGVSFFFHTISFQDLIGGGSSLITLLTRSIVDVPGTYFLPESLPTLQY